MRVPVNPPDIPCGQIAKSYFFRHSPLASIDRDIMLKPYLGACYPVMLAVARVGLEPTASLTLIQCGLPELPTVPRLF